MGESVGQVFISTYETNVRHLAQQGIARLMPWVQVKSVQSENHNWETMASNEATQKTTRATPTPDDDTQWARRQSIPVVYHIGDVTEQEDITQMLVDPNSNYARAHGMAMRRAHDDEIITAAVGPSRSRDGSPIAFDVNQNIGDGTTPLSFDITTEVTEKFMDNDVDPDEEKVMVIGPKQARKLLQLTEATSGDYNAVRPLTAKGYIESWMGYSWLVSTRLQEPDTDEIYCFAMTKRALGMQMNKDIWTRVTERDDISYAWQIYCASQFGAIRVEDEQLVRLHLANTL